MPRANPADTAKLIRRVAELENDVAKREEHIRVLVDEQQNLSHLFYNRGLRDEDVLRIEGHQPLPKAKGEQRQMTGDGSNPFLRYK